VMIRPALF